MNETYLPCFALGLHPQVMIASCCPGEVLLDPNCIKEHKNTLSYSVNMTVTCVTLLLSRDCTINTFEISMEIYHTSILTQGLEHPGSLKVSIRDRQPTLLSIISTITMSSAVSPSPKSDKGSNAPYPE
jgi:hypothetical protein